MLVAVMIAGICKKLGVGAKQNKPPSKGEYSLAHRKDEDSSTSIEVPLGGSSSISSSSSVSCMVNDSQLESSAEAILDDISKRA